MKSRKPNQQQSVPGKKFKDSSITFPCKNSMWHKAHRAKGNWNCEHFYIFRDVMFGFVSDSNFMTVWVLMSPLDTPMFIQMVFSYQVLVFLTDWLGGIDLLLGLVYTIFVKYVILNLSGKFGCHIWLYGSIFIKAWASECLVKSKSCGSCWIILDSIYCMNLKFRNYFWICKFVNCRVKMVKILVKYLIFILHYRAHGCSNYNCQGIAMK